MNQSPHTAALYPSPPWPATAGVLLAFTALALNGNALIKSGSNPLYAVAPIVVSAMAILLSFLIRARLEQGLTAAWIVRVAAISVALVYAFTVSTRRDSQTFYYMNFVARIAGLCFVGECAIQHWQRPPSGQSRNAVLVFLAAIIFVLASRTYDREYIKFLTLPFIILLVLSMRASRPRLEGSRHGVRLWMIALLLAALLGSAGALAIAAHGDELTRALLAIVYPMNYSDLTDANARPMLGKSFNQPLSPKRILRVEGPLAERHLRGRAFETYAAGGWSLALEARGQDDATPALKARPGGERVTVTPLLDNLAVLYLPLHMAGVDAKSYRLAWARGWGGAIYASSNLSPYPPYQIAVVNDSYPGPLLNTMNSKLRERCLELPVSFDPRVIAIARQLAAGATGTRDKLAALRKYLNRNHAYSLTIEPGPGDPVANFLLQKRDGHCQYFASSSVLLLRCMGVPARYITGYYAHESPDPNMALIRQRDAHAWAEVWIDGEGWETFDATPSGGMPGQAGGVSVWTRLWEKLGDLAESFAAWISDAPISKLALIAGGLIALGFIVRWLREWFDATRQNTRRFRYASAGHSYDTLATSFDEWLKRKSIPCPPQHTWIDHLAAQKIASPISKKTAPSVLDWDAAESFARAYNTARFGGDTRRETIERLNEQLKKLA